MTAPRARGGLLGRGVSSPPLRPAPKPGLEDLRERTPPRKFARPEPTEASENAAARGPQVIFSPGKRLCADGAAHDAAVEVKAFLRRKGIADMDIPGIMSTDNPSGSSSSFFAQAAGGGRAGGHAPKRLKLADHARTLTPAQQAAGAAHKPRGRSSSPESPSNTFSADLLDVLAGSSPPLENLDGSHEPPCHGAPGSRDLRPAAPAVHNGTLGLAARHTFLGTPAPMPPSSSPSTSSGSRATRLCPPMSQEVQAGLCAFAEEVDRRADAASQASQASPWSKDGREASVAQAPQSGQCLNSGREEENDEESCFEGIDDDAILAAVREVENRLMREREVRLSQSQAGPTASAPESLPLFG